ncbi:MULTISPECIES: hypothetical protein [unclassified Kribbella]|uniref:hypothetical protein n=1 Tax=unclassified Kribbella TaxID=2644121 RepID=UPI0030195769
MSVVDCVFVAVASSPLQVAELLREVAGCEGGFVDDLPMLLAHNLDTLVAAHLPGVGTHTFDQPISPDGPDVDVWRPWVL